LDFDDEPTAKIAPQNGNGAAPREAPAQAERPRSAARVIRQPDLLAGE
jgi:hypothetical protein